MKKMNAKKIYVRLITVALVATLLISCGGQPAPADTNPAVEAAVEKTLTALAPTTSPTPNLQTQVAQSVAATLGAPAGQLPSTPTATNAPAAVSGTNCTGIENISEPNEFDHVQNHDMGDPFNFWLLFGWDGANTDTWFGTVGEPMLSLDVEHDRIVGVEYIVKAESAEAVVCLAREIANKLGIKPYWLYIAKNDLDLPGGFSTDFPAEWTMHTRPYMEAPIEDGNDWIVNGQQFSPSSSNRTFGNANAYTLIQSWNTDVGFNPAQHVLTAPGYQVTFTKPYQGAIFQTTITVSLKRYFERVLQMVNEVIFRDSNSEITLTVYTSRCGPANGDWPTSWDDPLPAGVTCTKMP